MINKIKKMMAFPLLAILALTLVYSLWIYFSKKTLITPYPYNFNPQLLQTSLKNEIVEASSAQILIMGDQMGINLIRYFNGLGQDFEKNLNFPPKIYNWSRPHEGLHRTLFKLKSLHRFPQIIIYHGASSELYEKKFSVTDEKQIFDNFSLFDNEKVISLIIAFPWLSKLIYKKMNYYTLGEIKKYQNNLDGQNRLIEKKISFKIFEYELNDIINLTKDKKSHLILITTPLNLELPPKEVCPQTSNNQIIEFQQEIEEIIKEGNFKLAYSKALELSTETYSNAYSFYLLGKTSLMVGDLKLARESFQKATVFDCVNWRGNSVYNAIMKSKAQKNQIPLIDFDQYMSSALSGDGLFFDDYFPQNIFYETIINELKNELYKIFEIKK